MKDPCCLFYWGDWYIGTATMSHRHKGAYMDLLAAQFSSGHLSIGDIKEMLGEGFVMWDSKLREKFIKDKNEKFYNERLEFEIERRKTYTTSKLRNLQGRGGSRTETHTDIRTEIEIEIEKEIEKGNRKKKGGTGGKQFDYSFIDEKFRSIFDDWIDYKKSKNQMYKTQKSLEACYNNLLRLSMNSEESAREVVDQSMGNNWQGLFPVKQTGKVTEPKNFTGYIIKKQENKANGKG